MSMLQMIVASAVIGVVIAILVVVGAMTFIA